MSGTMSFLIQLAAMAAVAGLVTTAWMLGFRGKPKPLTPRKLAMIAIEEAGEAPVELIVDAEGRCGMALLGSRRLVVVRQLGARHATRLIRANGLADMRIDRPRAHKMGLTLLFHDLGFRSMRIEIDSKEPPAWLEQLRRAA
jgi:hypothetical protein